MVPYTVSAHEVKMDRAHVHYYIRVNGSLERAGDGAHLCLLRTNLLPLFPHLPAFFLPLFSEDHGGK